MYPSIVLLAQVFLYLLFEVAYSPPLASKNISSVYREFSLASLFVKTSLDSTKAAWSMQKEKE
jgi:hypothetical protein